MRDDVPAQMTPLSPNGARRSASSANDNVSEAAAQWADDVLNVTVRIEDHREAVARYGTQTIDAFRRHIEKWPVEHHYSDPANGRGVPSVRVVVLAEDDVFDGLPVRDGFIRTEFVKLFYGMGLVASLMLWALILNSFWMHP